jgi:hypothetical protein
MLLILLRNQFWADFNEFTMVEDSGVARSFALCFPKEAFGFIRSMGISSWESPIGKLDFLFARTPERSLTCLSDSPSRNVRALFEVLSARSFCAIRPSVEKRLSGRARVLLDNACGVLLISFNPKKKTNFSALNIKSFDSA